MHLREPVAQSTQIDIVIGTGMDGSWGERGSIHREIVNAATDADTIFKASMTRETRNWGTLHNIAAG
jgi:hypothetical protein